ncbi:Mannan-binding lectin serine protease 1, partial [Xenoophorus captivus]
TLVQTDGAGAAELWCFIMRCGAELLSEMYGSLQSPNFPEPYPRDTELNWNISVPDGFRISLFFSHFDLEPSYLCEYDFVKVSQEHLGLGQGLSESPGEPL